VLVWTGTFSEKPNTKGCKLASWHNMMLNSRYPRCSTGCMLLLTFEPWRAGAYFGQ